MRTIALSLLLLIASCGPRTPVNWPGLVECAPGVSDLVGIVSRILIGDGPAGDASISDSAVREFEDLARREGADDVACVVKMLVDDWTSPGASQEPLRLAAAARGEDFLSDVGTRPQLPESSALQ